MEELEHFKSRPEASSKFVKKIPSFFLGSATLQAPLQMFRAAPIKA